jgi:putative ABC transport system substrate-binding protein
MTMDKSRRLFLRHSVAAVIALPGLVIAQAPGSMRRIALLLSTNHAFASHAVKALVDGLAELGWVEGRNLRLDIRYAEGEASRFRLLAAELLGQRPEVLVVGTELIAREAATLTKTVPIAFALGNDPVGSGLVQSLARPGGNVTGISIMSRELTAKRFALLKEAMPGLTRVAVLYRTGDVDADRGIGLLAEPARTLGVAIVRVEVSNAAGLERAFEQIARQKAGGVVITGSDPLFLQHFARVCDLAIKHRLVFGLGVVEGASAGALFSYGPDLTAVYRHLATLIDKILKGARPADIPVEQVNIYEMVVNLKTARRLGIELPRSFLLQATQTIE